MDEQASEDTYELPVVEELEVGEGAAVTAAGGTGTPG
jgi:hypothetical protein